MGSSERTVKQMKGQREIWVDNVKVVACILVVLGHFFQSMTQSGVLPTNDLYKWFNQTIYYFHVPLFFICSGYLYQKLSRVDDIHSWGKNVLKKIDRAWCAVHHFFNYYLDFENYVFLFGQQGNRRIG